MSLIKHGDLFNNCHTCYYISMQRFIKIDFFSFSRDVDISGRKFVRIQVLRKQRYRNGNSGVHIEIAR